jgi:hypothetical protein
MCDLFYVPFPHDMVTRRSPGRVQYVASTLPLRHTSRLVSSALDTNTNKSCYTRYSFILCQPFVTEVRFPAGSEKTAPLLPDWLWCPTIQWVPGSLSSEVKRPEREAGTSMWFRGKQRMEPCLHPLRLRGVVFN